MPDSKYLPVKHDHATFLIKARQKAEFAEVYDALSRHVFLGLTYNF